MIAKADRDRAFAESVGSGLPPEVRGNGRYAFSASGNAEIVEFRDGQAVGEPYKGLGLADAVLRHMAAHPAPCFYSRLGEV